jgi:ankyrin repeat protein
MNIPKIILTSLLATSVLDAMEQDLFEYVKSGYVVRVRHLIEQHANVNAHDRDGLTALMHAAFFGRAEIAQLLIDSQADVNAGRGEIGWTALMSATSDGGYPDMVSVLLNAQADPTLQTRSGVTALKRAKAWHNQEIIKMIQESIVREEMKVLEEAKRLREMVCILCAIRAFEHSSFLSLIPNELLFLILEQIAPDGLKRLLKRDQNQE